MLIEVADVVKLLVSVYQLVHSGNRVVFDSVDSGGRYIEHKATVRRTKVNDMNGSFVFPLTTTGTQKVEGTSS